LGQLQALKQFSNFPYRELIGFRRAR
jgi:hypothetical protein